MGTKNMLQVLNLTVKKFIQKSLNNPDTAEGNMKHIVKIYSMSIERPNSPRDNLFPEYQQLVQSLIRNQDLYYRKKAKGAIQTPAYLKAQKGFIEKIFELGN